MSDFPSAEHWWIALDITLAGLELALLTMKKGEFAHVLLQPPYAYGEMGCPPLIPPAATVLYEIQVVDYFDSAQADHFVGLEPDQQNALPLSVLATVTNTLRNLANRCFNQGRYDAAKFSYKKAEKEKEEEAGEVKDVKALLLPVYLNLSLTELHLESPRKALKCYKNGLDQQKEVYSRMFKAWRT
ncbi:hypothetical protein CRUP_023612 [Coryphaenoides rupestris]|nr:hypothetical protein CRUP_023612 [Coryphaenoides rupestris]